MRTNRFVHEGGELVLHVDSRYGVMGQSVGEDVIGLRWQLALDELAERGRLKVEKNRKDWKIRRGPKLLAVERMRR